MVKSNFLKTAVTFLFLGACHSPEAVKQPQQGFPVKFLVGSALEQFCNQAATQFNQTTPQLDNGKAFYLQCEAKGSGDVVQEIAALAEQFQAGAISPDNPEFPTLLSVDGEIYHSQLIYHVNNFFPGQNYIPQITDAPLLAHSPMVFMAAADLAPGLRQQEDLYQALVGAENHQDLDPNSPQLPINFVHTAPTHSNSGLQTLVAQFASVSGKAPEKFTITEVRQYQGAVQSIQSKVTRYGTSTSSLAQDMVQNGPYWASIASVYESSVIAANSNSQGNDKYEAIYPKTTFTSNMRGILPTAPWVSKEERAAAEQFLTYLRTPEVQQIATAAGLRPGVPGVSLSSKFSLQFGVDPKAKYSSLRPPQPEVVAAMIQSWQQFAKKPSQVVVVVDSSSSMAGNKLPAVQNTLRNYITNLGPQENIALIDFDSEIRPPILADGTGAGQNRGLQFIASLKAEGGTRLYDATLFARDWLRQNLRQNAINAVIILTDGEDSGSNTNLNALTQQLQASGFASDERIAFFTIGYGEAGEFNPQVLEQIAASNGGYYRQGDPANISTLMSDLQLEF